MRKVEELQQEIQQLSREELAELRAWFWDHCVDDHDTCSPLTSEQRTELDRCLDAYEADRKPGRPAEDVIAENKKRL